MVWSIAVVLAAALGAAGGAGAQDPPISLQEFLRKRLGNQTDRYFSAEQVQELEQLLSRKLSAISDPALRAKTATDAREFIVRQAASNVFVGVDPQKEGDGQVQVSRSPSAWELSKYELEHRIDLAPAHQKSPEDVARIDAQLDRLAQAARTRLYDIFIGPGGQVYVNATVDRWKDGLHYYAASNLEFLLSKPLTEEEYRNLEHLVATFIPDKTLDPAYQKNPNQVFIADANNPPYRANFLTTFGVFRKVREYLYGISHKEDFYDEKYKKLQAAMQREFDEKGKDFQSSSKRPTAEGEEPSIPGPSASGRPAGKSSAPSSTEPGRQPDAAESKQPSGGRVFGMLLLIAGAVLLAGFLLRRIRKPAA